LGSDSDAKNASKTGSRKSSVALDIFHHESSRFFIAAGGTRSSTACLIASATCSTIWGAKRGPAALPWAISRAYVSRTSGMDK